MLRRGTRNDDRLGSHVVTLVERPSRYVILDKVANKQTATVVSALIGQARKLPVDLCRSLTWDRC